MLFTKTSYKNRKEQFEKAYLVAKKHAKLSCLINYGALLDSKI